MKASTVFALFLAVESVTAFSIVQARTRQTFALRYTVIEGLDEEDIKDAEDAAFDRGLARMLTLTICLIIGTMMK
jgi:hypothetical protein